jgi:hypothetical protein
MQSIQPRPQLMAMYGAPGDGNSAAYPRAAEAWHGPTLSVEEDDLGKGGGGVRGDARLVVEIVHSGSQAASRPGARSPTKARAPCACSPAQMRRAASAFGLHRRRPTRTRVHAKAELCAGRHDGWTVDDAPRREIGELQVRAPSGRETCFRSAAVFGSRGSDGRTPRLAASGTVATLGPVRARGGRGCGEIRDPQLPARDG